MQHSWPAVPWVAAPHKGLTSTGGAAELGHYRRPCASRSGRCGGIRARRRTGCRSRWHRRPDVRGWITRSGGALLVACRNAAHVTATRRRFMDRRLVTLPDRVCALITRWPTSAGTYGGYTTGDRYGILRYGAAIPAPNIDRAGALAAENTTRPSPRRTPWQLACIARSRTPSGTARPPRARGPPISRARTMPPPGWRTTPPPSRSRRSRVTPPRRRRTWPRGDGSSPWPTSAGSAHWH